MLDRLRRWRIHRVLVAEGFSVVWVDGEQELWLRLYNDGGQRVLLTVNAAGATEAELFTHGLPDGCVCCSPARLAGSITATARVACYITPTEGWL